ncbi:MAG TPA: hypothetical protein VKT29_08385 [Terriglobales bacterium]|nr:hypothetical protein [Terriglobales bacterium]
MSWQIIRRTAWITVAGMLVFLAACSMNVDDKGENKNVDIRTPLGALKVHTNPTPAQVGLSVYPGAKPKIEGNDRNAANVNISSSLFGVKVLVIAYHSDDPPDKVIAYYKKDLQKYGNVLECHGHSDHGNVSLGHDSDNKPKPLTCGDEKGGGQGVELKAGMSDNFHLVAVDPKDKGSDFALVYVVTRGESEPM